jgi:putative ABC transport system permease protein
MPVSGSQRLAENRRVVEDHLLLVVEFLGAAGWLMLAIGAMGLASSLGLSVLERTRELGVLRAIGARHGQIAALVAGEGLVIALLAWLLALPVSVPMSIALGEAFGA